MKAFSHPAQRTAPRYPMWLACMLYAACITSCASTYAGVFTVIRDTILSDTRTVWLSYHLPDQTAIIADSINIVSTHPEYRTHMQLPEARQTVYNERTRTTDETLPQTGTVTTTISGPLPHTAYDLLVHYRTIGSDTIQEAHIGLQSLADAPKAVTGGSLIPSDSVQAPVQKKSLIESITTFFTDLTQRASNLLSSSGPLWIKLLAVYVLGILMSLTPCIYPMIPITVGILQATASRSFFRNFLMACSYTCGIASTFAVLGMLAATGSAQFGQLMGEPWFVYSLVVLLGYLALTMIGVLELYVPSFMQPSTSTQVDGSFISAFILGAMSGTITSPCVSPGLLLLLSVVATLGSIVAGFVLLFTFGLGLGTPLLLIGTFSHSVKFLPRAGMWMVEVKTLFGALLFSMCCYYLANIWPLYAVYALAAILCAAGILWYGSHIAPYDSSGMRLYKYSLMGVLALGAGWLGVQAYALYMVQRTSVHQALREDYCQARQEALSTQRYVLLDFGAAWCTACKQLEKKFLLNATVQQALEQSLIIVHVDGTRAGSGDATDIAGSLIQRFEVRGFPALVLVDPVTEFVIARWSTELLSSNVDAFIRTITDAIPQKPLGL